MTWLLFDTRLGDFFCRLVERTTKRALVIRDHGRGLALVPLHEIQ